MKLISSTFHPFLFAIFPVLFLFANNIYIVSADDLIIPLFTVISFTIISWFILKLVTKNSKKSGIITSLFLILFFSYGHIFISVNNNDILGSGTPSHYYFVIPFIIIFSIGTFLVLSTKRTLYNATKISNAISITLVAITIINISIFGIEHIFIAPEGSESQILSSMKNEINDYPDIYYIIFDAYANSNTLINHYGFDNTSFIDYLKTKDFVIPSQSHGNYPITGLALLSSLNMQYINDEIASVNHQKAQANAHKIISNNAVMKNLKEKGYKIISFDSGVRITNSIQIADQHLCGSSNLNSEFIGMIIRTSMLYPIHVKLFEHDFRDGINCIFEELPNLKERTEQPIFVFAHFLTPHPPYIFGANGETVDIESLSLTDNWDDHKGYVDQVQYANKKIKNVLDEMLSDEYSPIVIIQSDHGPRDGDMNNLDDKTYDLFFGILNAYHLPNGGNKQIYESISPINSFRVIFNYYFDGNYELLDDIAYAVTKDTAEGPYNLDVRERSEAVM